MNGTRHLPIGIGTGLALATGQDVPTMLNVITIAGIASLLPDLDTGRSLASKGARWTARAGAVSVGGLVMYVAAGHQSAAVAGVVGLSTVIGSTLATSLVGHMWGKVEHRGPMHSVLAAVSAGLVVFGVGWLLLGSCEAGVLPGLAMGLGWLSHLMADAGTFAGEPLWWPLLARSHWHKYDRALSDGRRFYSCRRFHVTPVGLRWRSGTGVVEWPLALAVLLFGVAMYAGWLQSGLSQVTGMMPWR